MLSARAWWFGAFAWTIAKCVLVNNIFPKGTSKKLAKRRSERRRRLTKAAEGQLNVAGTSAQAFGGQMWGRTTSVFIGRHHLTTRLPPPVGDR